jgi:hemerythrin
MIAKVREYCAAYEKDREGTINDLSDFLKGWLVEHIQGTDQKYVPFLHEKGVS